MTRYQRTEGYHYSKEVFTYQSKAYRPIVGAEYVGDTLFSVSVFKSEGVMNYLRADIQADSLLFQTLNVPFTSIIEMSENQLIDNGKSYQITELKGDSVFIVDSDLLFLFCIK